MAASFNNIHNFDPSQIGDLSGKTVLVTGGNTGLGYQTVKNLAPHGATVVFTSRSEQKANDAIAAIKKDAPDAKVSFIQMDLTSLASVQAAARTFLASHSRLDILITNAGIMNVPAALTKDGYEIQFGTNHVGHALLIKLLLPTLLRTAGASADTPASSTSPPSSSSSSTSDVRIISLSSEGHRASSSIDFVASKTPRDSALPLYGYMRYGPSKLANLLYARQLAARYPSILSVSVHPGVVSTELASHLGWAGKAFITASTRLVGLKMLTPAQGALTQTWAAVAPRDQLTNGVYYTPVGVEGKQEKVVKEGKLELELWDWTQEELKGWEL